MRGSRACGSGGEGEEEGRLGFLCLMLLLSAPQFGCIILPLSYVQASRFNLLASRFNLFQQITLQVLLFTNFIIKVSNTYITLSFKFFINLCNTKQLLFFNMFPNKIIELSFNQNFHKFSPNNDATSIFIYFLIN